MKRSFVLIAALVIATIASSGKDRLFIRDFNIAAGNTMQIPVLLMNDTAYSGLQTDLYLPTGLSLDMEDDEYIIDLTSRKDRSHTVVSRKLDDGAIRIYVSSVSAREFSGNSGAILTLSVTAANDFNEQAVIELKNNICAEAIGTRHILDDEVCKVNSYKKCDINDDKEVSIADINILIDIILGGKVAEQIRKRADVNDDREINIADINTVIDVILSL